MKEKKKYLQGTSKVLLKCQREKKKYKIKVLEKTFTVYPNVFSPKYFHDPEFFVEEIHVRKGETFLEIGCGTGIISIFVALKGAKKIVATDINPNAIKNAKENVKLHKLDKIIEVREGDVYKPIKQKEKFNTIFWNFPWRYTERKNMSLLEKSVFNDYNSLEKFVKGAKSHLKDKGKIIIGFSTTMGHGNKLEEILKKAKFKWKIIAQTRSKETYDVKFELFEAKLR